MRHNIIHLLLAQQHSFWVLLLVLFSITFLVRGTLLQKTVYGDGIYYYSYARSWIVDHDYNFSNEYDHFQVTQPKTNTHLLANVYAVGPALFWAPTFIHVHQVLRGDGYTLPYQLAVGLSSVFAFFVGLLLLQRVLRKYFSDEISFVTVLLIGLGSNLLFYGVLDPVNSHAISFLIATVVLTAILEKRSALLTGFFIGLLALTRSQDMIFLVLFLPSLRRLSLGIVGAGVAFCIQLLSWQILYGTFFTSPYLDSYHYFDFLRPQILQVLFSPNNGLFLWTPLLIFCVAGLFLRSFPSTAPRYRFILLFLLQLYLVASWSFWWQGASFSGRMFISILPVLAFGLATSVGTVPKNVQQALVPLFILINGISMLWYLVTH